MKPISYASKVLLFSVKNFAARAELTYALISIVASFWLGPKDRALADITTYDLGAYSAYALGAYLLLRLFIAGPYYVWAEERDRADGLQEIADHPARLERESFSALRAQKRLDLIGAIRTVHAAAVHGDEDGWGVGINNVIALEPLAISDGSHRDELRGFLELSEAFLRGQKTDHADLQAASEDLMRKVHKL